MSNNTAIEILAKCHKEGISLTVQDGNLKISSRKGTPSSDIIELIKHNKAEIKTFLEELDSEDEGTNHVAITPYDRSKA